MNTPFLSHDPGRFSEALRRIAARERAVPRTFLQRLCRRPAPRAQTERTVRIPGGETIHSNLAT